MIEELDSVVFTGRHECGYLGGVADVVDGIAMVTG